MPSSFSRSFDPTIRRTVGLRSSSQRAGSDSDSISGYPCNALDKSTKFDPTIKRPVHLDFHHSEIEIPDPLPKREDGEPLGPRPRLGRFTGNSITSVYTSLRSASLSPARSSSSSSSGSSNTASTAAAAAYNTQATSLASLPDLRHGDIKLSSPILTDTDNDTNDLHPLTNINNRIQPLFSTVSDPLSSHIDPSSTKSKPDLFGLARDEITNDHIHTHISSTSPTSLGSKALNDPDDEVFCRKTGKWVKLSNFTGSDTNTDADIVHAEVGAKANTDISEYIAVGPSADTNTADTVDTITGLPPLGSKDLHEGNDEFLSRKTGKWMKLQDVDSDSAYVSEYIAVGSSLISDIPNYMSIWFDGYALGDSGRNYQ